MSKARHGTRTAQGHRSLSGEANPRMAGDAWTDSPCRAALRALSRLCSPSPSISSPHCSELLQLLPNLTASSQTHSDVTIALLAILVAFGATGVLFLAARILRRSVQQVPGPVSPQMPAPSSNPALAPARTPAPVSNAAQCSHLGVDSTSAPASGPSAASAPVHSPEPPSHSSKIEELLTIHGLTPQKTLKSLKALKPLKPKPPPPPPPPPASSLNPPASSTLIQPPISTLNPPPTSILNPPPTSTLNPPIPQCSSPPNLTASCITSPVPPANSTRPLPSVPRLNLPKSPKAERPTSLRSPSHLALRSPSRSLFAQDPNHGHSLKISRTTPDIPAAAELSASPSVRASTSVSVCQRRPGVLRIQRQATEPADSQRHSSFRRNLPRQLTIWSSFEAPPSSPAPNPAGSPSSRPLLRTPSLSPLGRIKPELYQEAETNDNTDEKPEKERGGTSTTRESRPIVKPGPPAGKLNFSLRYDHDNGELVVRVVRAQDLPIKDRSGSSDPYVKVNLLPDWKQTKQTRVHRKTLDPLFDEIFRFPLTFAELPTRSLRFGLYDFDRFTRHDIIGHVDVDNLLFESDLSREEQFWRDVEGVTEEKDGLGELMFSLCYLPTAGRLTLTIIKARNLKAMDITGSSDPYVKVSLICSGKRLKKRKTTRKRGTLQPVYNEALVFDVPPDSAEVVGLLIAVVDYDRVGHNEVIGHCGVGMEWPGLGREHWNEMLAYPRRPVARWHTLQEWPGRTSSTEGPLTLPHGKIGKIP
uniref:Synaptotagmin X n=1 Tax=Eptatretus burgeri TaxID=7764 RepID=A0A8C4QT10_EPTBU